MNTKVQNYLTEVWKTSDGKIFFVEKEANLHQTILDFDAGYSDVNIYGPADAYPDAKVDAETVRTWLLENRELVVELLEGTD